MKSNPEVTIIVAPRERFSNTCESLESIYEHTQDRNQRSHHKKTVYRKDFQTRAKSRRCTP